MKIAEVRALLKTYSEDQLRIIVAEMYKAIPKTIKQDKEIDDILTNPEDYKKPGKRKKKKVTINPVDLLHETDEFIDHAYQQYFLVPNTIVPKRKRPKWRFIAKRLHNNLLALAKDPDFSKEASERLERLYVMLCYSCGYTLFSAYDTFESVGIEQWEFFQSVMILKTRSESSEAWIEGGIRLIVENSVNRYNLYEDLILVLLQFLKTPATKEAAIEACKKMYARHQKGMKKDAHERRGQFKIVGRLNCMVELVFRIFAALHEFQRGIEYFADHHVQDRSEVKLYILLRMLFEYEQKDLFAKEYKKAVKMGVKPRESLVHAYKTLKTSGELPEYL